MNKYNKIEFCRDDYENEAKMMQDIFAIIKILLRAKYQIKMIDDGLTVALEFNFQDKFLSGVSLEWVGEDEYIETLKNNSENND